MLKTSNIILIVILLQILSQFSGNHIKLCQQDMYEVISGVIVDSQSKITLSGINVYLSGTTIGTTTNTKGEYTLKIKRRSVNDLVISCVGYQTKIIRVDLNIPHPSVLDIELKNISYQLKPITVSANDDAKWRNQFEYFKNLFLGKREFVSECRFINGYYLDFIENEVLFMANTKVPIQVINQDLGYSVSIIFDSFEYNKLNNTLKYKVYPQFSEIYSTNNDSLTIFNKNRRSAYHGSLMEMLRILSDGGSEYEKYGYELFYLSGKKIIANVLSADEIIIHDKDTDQYYLSPTNGSMLRFGFKCEGLKIKYYGIKNEETSYIISLNGNGIEYSRDSGAFLYPSEYLIKGNWGEYGFADQLPTNYISK